MKIRGKKWWLLIAALLIVIGLPLTITQIRHNTPSDYPEIAARGVLRVGIVHSPLSYNVEGDSISGYDYELLQMLSRHSQLEIKIDSVSSVSHCMQQLDKHKYDIIAYPIPITSKIKEKYIFSNPTSLNKQVLIQRVDSTNSIAIRNLLDLHGCTLHITQDNPTRMHIENLAQESGNRIHICEKHNHGVERLIEEVACGKIDFAVCDKANAALIASQYNNINYDTDISLTQFMSWMMRKESTILCDSINHWLMDIQQTDEFRELYTRYFGAKSYNKQQRVNCMLYIQQQDSTKTEEAIL